MLVRYLDSETTGLHPEHDEVVELAILDEGGRVLLDTRVRPVRLRQWPAAQRIHHITPADVLRDQVPTLAELAPVLVLLLAGCELRIFNAEFDMGFLGEVLAQSPPARVVCLMRGFAEFFAEPSPWGSGHKWQSLSMAAAHALHEWQGQPHSALADCHAARAVAHYLYCPATRAAIDAERTRRNEVARAQLAEELLEWEAERTLRQWERAAAQVLAERNAELTYQFLPRLLAPATAWTNTAYQSAEVWCPHLTGYPLAEWLTYSPEQLALPRYAPVGCRTPCPLPELPAGLAPGTNGVGGVCFLRQQPAAAGMLVRRGGRKPLLVPVYPLDNLLPGIDYVPFVQQWPADHCTGTALRRTHCLTREQVRQLRPALAKVTRYGTLCLLYSVPVFATGQ